MSSLSSYTRRKFLKDTSLGVFSILLANKNQSASKLPNIIVIITDDLNTTFFQNEIYLPYKKFIRNLTKPTSNSVYFPNAYCQNPLCIPSRASLFTGLHSFSNQIYLNENMWSYNLVTIPEILKNSGYFTIGVGKIFHNETKEKKVWDLYEEGNYPEIKFAKNRIGVSDIFDWGVIPLEENEFGDFISIKKSIEILEKCKKPFFLAVGLRLPHMPLFVPKGFIKSLGITKIPLPITLKEDLTDIPEYALKLLKVNDKINIHEVIVKSGLWEEIVLYYFFSIVLLDKAIEKFIRTIEQMGLLKNSYLLFLSDNGWHLGEKEHWRKWTLWRESVNVPLALHFPDSNTQDTITTPVGLVDIFPTILEMAKVREGLNFEGESLLPIVKNPSEKQRVIISQIGKSNFSFRTSEWTYIVYENGEEELYDVKSDPHEWHNLIKGNTIKKYDIEGIKKSLFTKVNENIREKLSRYLPDSAKSYLF